MSMKPISQFYTTVSGRAPAASTATTTGTAIDLANVVENVIYVIPGLWTDGTHTLSLTDSADNTTYAACAAGDLITGSANTAFGTAISSTATAVIQSVSYIGSKRYVKHVITVSGATTGAIIGVVAVLGKHKKNTT